MDDGVDGMLLAQGGGGVSVAHIERVHVRGVEGRTSVGRDDAPAGLSCEATRGAPDQTVRSGDHHHAGFDVRHVHHRHSISHWDSIRLNVYDPLDDCEQHFFTLSLHG